MSWTIEFCLDSWYRQQYLTRWWISTLLTCRYRLIETKTNWDLAVFKFFYQNRSKIWQFWVSAFGIDFGINCVDTSIPNLMSISNLAVFYSYYYIYKVDLVNWGMIIRLNFRRSKVTFSGCWKNNQEIESLIFQEDLSFTILSCK
jgi:hypothetical protein